MTSITDYIDDLDDLQLMHAKELIERRLAEIEQEKKVQIWELSNEFEVIKHFPTEGIRIAVNYLDRCVIEWNEKPCRWSIRPIWIRESEIPDYLEMIGEGSSTPEYTTDAYIERIRQCETQQQLEALIDEFDTAFHAGDYRPTEDDWPRITHEAMRWKVEREKQREDGEKD